LIVAGISGIFGANQAPLIFQDVQSGLLLPEENEIKANLEHRLDAINARKAQWDSQRRADFEQHMNKIDESLKLCRHMLEGNPNDAGHQEMVRALYDEKRRLLEDVERLKW
jgi:hypothetical protein